MTKTVTSGQYKHCPITRLPTGYICWCVENNKLEVHHRDFFIELQQRILQRQEPRVDETVVNEPWFEEWPDNIQRQYVSMLTEGCWQWTGETKTAIVQYKLLETVYLDLVKRYMA